MDRKCSCAAHCPAALALARQKREVLNHCLDGVDIAGVGVANLVRGVATAEA